jgi:hypothetical protein
MPNLPSLAVLLAFASLACGHEAVVPAARPAAEACVTEVGPANHVLHDFRRRLLALTAADSLQLSEMLQEQVEAFHRENHAVLMAQSRWMLGRLPKIALPDLDQLPDAPQMTPAVTERMAVVLADVNDADGIAFGKMMGLLSADLLHAFAGIRGYVTGAVGGPTNKAWMDALILEKLAPPRIARANDDEGHQILVMAKRKDMFVMAFERDPVRDVFVPKRIRWVARPKPAEPQHEIRTAEDAYQSFATAMEASPLPSAENTTGQYLRVIALANELAKQWLDPHRELLRRHGVCEFHKLPFLPLPDLSAWQESKGVWEIAGPWLRLPQSRWNPVATFAFVRSSVLARALRVRDYQTRTVIDGLVPPTVSRANDDPANPVLAEVDGNLALVVTFAFDPTNGYVPKQVRFLRRE